MASRAVAHIKRGDTVIVSTTVGDRVRGDKNWGADPILRFLALLDWVDEAAAPELRAERAARVAHHAEPAPVRPPPATKPAVHDGGADPKRPARGRA